MRNAQKTALMAVFAAIEDDKAAAERTVTSEKPAASRKSQPIQVDPLWLLTRGAKGRA
ncbi:MAG: hypothetical protein AB7G40_16875 [Hyphomonadaceae bacterium]